MQFLQFNPALHRAEALRQRRELRVPYTPGATRQRLSKAQKLKSVLQLDRCKWTLSDFLHAVFTLHDDAGNPIVREPQHEQIIIAAVNGTTKPQLAEIVELMYLNATRTGYRANDRREKRQDELESQRRISTNVLPR